MPASAEDIAAVRAHYVNEAGKGQLVEELLAERANTAAYGGDTSGADKRLSELGWPFQSREKAAEKRAEASEKPSEDEERPARARPPQGRTAPQGRQQST